MIKLHSSLMLAPVLATLIASTAFADDVSSQYVDMSERKQKLIKVLAVDDDPASSLNVDVFIRSNLVAPPDIRLWAVTTTAKIELDVSADGVIELGPDERLFSDLTAFEITPRSEDTYQFGAKITPRLPVGTLIKGADIRMSVDEMNALIRQEAGALSVLAPKMKGVRARTTPFSTATMTATGKPPRVVRADEEGWIDLKWRLSKLETVSFETAPTEFDFLD